MYKKPTIGLDINQKYFIFSKKHMTSLDHIMVPKLNWDDRRIELQMALQKQNQQKNSDSETNFGSLSFQNQRENQVILPKKLIVCGRYRNLDPSELKFSPSAEIEQPFVALIDLQELETGRTQQGIDLTMIKCLQSDTQVQITVVNYGPFDNGHICVGFNTGHILILSSFDLASIYRT